MKLYVYRLWLKRERINLWMIYSNHIEITGKSTTGLLVDMQSWRVSMWTGYHKGNNSQSDTCEEQEKVNFSHSASVHGNSLRLPESQHTKTEAGAQHLFSFFEIFPLKREKRVSLV